MPNNKTFLAVILARGKNKPLPRKNILNLVDKPRIAWNIEAGLKSKYIDKLLVSSDDEEVSEIANKFGFDTLKKPDGLPSLYIRHNL